MKKYNPFCKTIRWDKISFEEMSDKEWAEKIKRITENVIKAFKEKKQK